MLPDYDNPDPEKHAPSTAAVDDTAHTSDSLHRRTSSSSKLDNDDSSAPHDLGGNQSLPARTSSLGPRPSVEFRPASRKNERFPQRLLASYGAHHQHKSKHDTEDGKHVVSPTRPSFGRRPSDDSIRSNFSTTSSILSTASKISRLPHAVKSSFISVKDYVKSNKSKSKAQNRLTMAAPYQPEQQYQNPQFTAQTIHYSTPSSAPFAERDSFSSRLLHRGTPSAMGLAAMFSSSSSSSSASSANISPSASTSYSVLEAKEARSRNFSMDGQHSPRAISKTDTAAPHNTRRRNSVVDAAARFLRRDDSPQAHRSRVSAITEDDGEEIKFGFSDEFEKAIHGENDPPAEPSADSGAVGKLLFGVDIGNMEFFEQDFAKSATSSNISTLSRDTDLPSDAKSDYVTSKASSHEVVWGRQRAKSCQETKVPSLRQLAKGQYASTAALSSHTSSSSSSPPPPLPPPPAQLPADTSATNSDFSTIAPGILPVAGSSDVSQGHRKLDAPKTNTPYNTFLITATLTTLHSKLISDCDQTLASTIIPPSQASVPPSFPNDRLINIAHDLRKMADMVEWESSGPLSKDAVTAYFEELNCTISRTRQKYNSDTVEKGGKTSVHQIRSNMVKEIISTMKQMINQCICQYHKVSEKAIVIPCKGYKIEGKNKFGEGDAPTSTLDYTEIPVDHMDEGAYWYRSSFIGKDYVTFFGYLDDDDPVLFSIVSEECDSQKQFRVIIRTKQGPDVRKVIPDSFLLNAPSSDQSKKNVIPDSTWKAVIENASDISFRRLRKLDHNTMISSGLENELLRLDESAVHDRYKFGVLLVKNGQTREEEWLSNNHDSEPFKRFVDIIGQKVALQGYSGWAAGLDTKTGDSGEYTYVNRWKDHSIAYHVSTLIPVRPGDKQQVQRKRHIGNDIVCIVFAEGNQPFNPAAIKSQFLHVFIVVQEETINDQTGWRVEVVMVEQVPDFGPDLSKRAFFTDASELRSFILAKVINAEYAAYKSPKFAQPMARAREGILSNIVERGYKMAHDTHISSKHNKSPSTSSEKSSRSGKSSGAGSGALDTIMPSPSRSSMIKDLSEGLAGLGRRRSGQDSTPASENVSSTRNKKATGRQRKANPRHGGEQRTRSEQDLARKGVTSSSSSSSSAAAATATTTTTTLQAPSPLAPSQSSNRAVGSRKDGIKHRAQHIFTSFSRQ